MKRRCQNRQDMSKKKRKERRGREGRKGVGGGSIFASKGKNQKLGVQKVI